MNRMVHALLPLWTFLVISPICGASDAPKTQLNAMKLRSLLFEAQQRIRSLYVVYESHDYNDKSLPSGYFLRRVVACQGPDSLFHWTAHGHDGLDWQDDPTQQIARVLNGVILNEYPIDRSFYKAKLKLKEEGLPGSLPKEFLFSTVGFWPLSGVKPPRLNGEPYVLPEIAQCESYDYVRPLLESVEGRWCHVLERRDVDRLWLDVDHGCAMIARETYAKSTGRLAQRLELGGHREFAPGIWFPTWITNIQYDHGATDPQKQMRVWKNAKHDFLEVRINQIDEQLFRWIPPAGALRIYDDAPSVQVKAGGLDHLNLLSEWIRRSHKVSSNHKQLYSSIKFCIFCAVLIVIIGEAYIGIRQKLEVHLLTKPCHHTSSDAAEIVDRMSADILSS